MANLENLSKDELITLCRQQEEELTKEKNASNLWYDKWKKSNEKITTLKNIISYL